MQTKNESKRNCVQTQSGADNRNRTCMKESSLEPESSASASSAISAYILYPLNFYTVRAYRGGATA